MLDVMNMFSCDSILHLREDKAEIVEVSVDHTCLIHAEIDLSVFGVYDYDKDEDISFNMKKWNVIIKTLKGEVSIETEGSLVYVKCGKSTYTVTQNYITGVSTRMPNVPFDVSFSISMPDFKRAIDVCSEFAEIVHLKTDEDSFIVYANMNANSSNIVFPIEELKDVEPCMTFASSALVYTQLSNFFKYVKSDTVRISLGTDVPTNYRFTLMDGNLIGDFMVAPIIGDD